MSEMDTLFAECAYDYLAFEGSDAVDLLGRLSTGDLRPLHQPMVTGLTAFTTNQGKMLDWCTALSTADGLMLRCSKGRGTKIKEWIEQYIIMEDATIRDVSSQWKSYTLLNTSEASGFGLEKWPEFGQLASAEGALFVGCLPAWGSRSDVLVAHEQSGQWIERLQGLGIGTASEEMMEYARLMAGVPSERFEFAREVNPLELRLADSSICFDKGCYIGQEVIARMDSYDKTVRVLMGFECDSELVLDAAMRLRQDGKSVGKVTSLLNQGGKSLGLAVIQKDSATPGELELGFPDGSSMVRLIDRPFWQS